MLRRFFIDIQLFTTCHNITNRPIICGMQAGSYCAVCFECDTMGRSIYVKSNNTNTCHNEYLEKLISAINVD